MISRIFTAFRLPSSLFILPSALAFSFASEVRRRSFESIVRPENCKNISELAYFVSKNGDLNDDQVAVVFERASKFRYSLNTSENPYQIQKLVEEIEFQKFPLDTLSNIASIYQIFKLSKSHKLYKKFEALSQEIDKRSEEFENLSPDSLIYLIQFGQEFGKSERLIKLNSILESKIPQLRYSSYPRILEHFSKVKFPNSMQKNIWNKFFDKYSTQVLNFDNKFIIGQYKFLKKINPFIYKMNDTVDVIEKKLKKEIDDLDEKSIINLLSYKSSNNIFIKILYSKIIDSVEEDGTSFLEPQLFLKIMIKICSQENFKLGFRSEAKVLNLVTKHLQSHSNKIIELVKRKFFTKKQLEQIVEKITENSCEDRYFKNSAFVFELIEKSIFLKDNFAAYIESRGQLVPGEAITSQYMYFSLIIEKLLSRDKKDTRIRQIHEKIVNNLPQSIEASAKYWNNREIPEHSLVVAFNERYYWSFYANFIKVPLKQQIKQVPLSVLKYLLVSNRFNDLQKILIEKNNFNQKKINQLIDLVQTRPQKYTGCYSTVNKIIIKFIKSQPVEQGKVRFMNNKILRYICNWEIHEALNVEEASSLASLVRLVVAEYFGKTMKTSLSSNLLMYILQSPSESIKNTKEYDEFLKQVQIKILEDKETNKIKYPKFIFLRQILRNNTITRQFAQYFLDSNFINSQSHYWQIMEIVAGKQFNPKAYQTITKENIGLILRNRKVSTQFLTSKFEEIVAEIDKLDLSSLVSILNSFGIRHQKGFEILGHIMKKIVESGKPIYIQRIPNIFSNLDSFNLKSNEYKTFLKYVLELVTKNINILSMENHNELLNECLIKSVDCEQYSKKLQKQFTNRIRAFDIHSKGEKNLALRLFSLSPKEGIKNFIDCIKFSHPMLRQEMLNYLILADFEDQKSQYLICSYFKNNQGLVINKGIFEYLASNIPELKSEDIKVELEEKLQQNYFQEKLKNYLEQNKIEFSRLQKNGQEGILTNSKTFIYFFRDRHNFILQKSLNEFLRFNFELEQKQKIVIIFTNEKTNKQKSYVYSKVLSDDVEELQGQREKILAHLQQRQNKEGVLPPTQ